jgi:hypothetical protein
VIPPCVNPRCETHDPVRLWLDVRWYCGIECERAHRRILAVGPPCREDVVPVPEQVVYAVTARQTVCDPDPEPPVEDTTGLYPNRVPGEQVTQSIEQPCGITVTDWQREVIEANYSEPTGLHRWKGRWFG